MAVGAGIMLRQGGSGKIFRGSQSGEALVWNETDQEWEAGPVVAHSSPIYIEDYLEPDPDPDDPAVLHAAIIAAFLANTDPGGVFLLPPGRWALDAADPITLADGFRNDLTVQGQGTELYYDQEGVASGQRIFFLRSDTGTGHADRIIFRDIKFSLLNALTSYFGFAVGLEWASNCQLINCEFFCTLDAAATTGRIRWGAALLGGDQVADPTAGTNNFVDRITLTLSQIQLCSAGRSVDGITAKNIVCHSANDLILSCVSTTGFNVRNVTVDGVLCHDIAGSGGLLIGSDGQGTGIGAAIVENITLTNLSLDGIRDPDLDFSFTSFVIFDGGLVTQNIAIANVNTTLVSTEVQSRSVIVNSQDDETSWHGLSLTNLNLGIVTTNDPLEPLFISGITGKGLQLTNVWIRGLRGIRIINWDQITVDNCNMLNGTLLILAEARNLDGIAVSNSTLKRSSGFNPALFFQSTTGKNMANVTCANLVLDSQVDGLRTGLTGGTMSMLLCNVHNVSGSNFVAETLTGIVRAVNLRRAFVFTPLTVAVPVVAAGAVGYVTVSLAGTRLADLVVNEGVRAQPTVDLVAAGVGGGFINCWPPSTGNLRFSFLGPLAGGNEIFNVYRTAA